MPPSGEVVYEVETCPLCANRNLLAVVTYYEDWSGPGTTGVRQRDESSDGVLCSNAGCDGYDRQAAEIIRHFLHRGRFG